LLSSAGSPFIEVNDEIHISLTWFKGRRAHSLIVRLKMLLLVLYIFTQRFLIESIERTGLID